MTIKKSLIHVHSGLLSKFSECIFDSIFQTILINSTTEHCQDIDIYVLLDESEIHKFNKRLNSLSWDIYNLTPIVKVYSIESLKLSIDDVGIDDKLKEFRGGFWSHTLTRFYIMEAFIHAHDLSLVFHIENDVMMYKSFETIYKHCNRENSNIWAVKDTHNRVVPSILFFPNKKSISRLVKFIKDALSIEFKNDMDILGVYNCINALPVFPNEGTFMVFDGAAIGQFLGGIDSRNVSIDSSLECYKKTKGFINETSIFKADNYKYYYKRVDTGINKIDVPVITSLSLQNSIVNLHVHSKMLPMFSSLYSVKYDSIISGDRVLSLCDFVITTNSIFEFHKESNVPLNKFIIVEDFNNVNTSKFGLYFKETRKTHISIFIYTHILHLFQDKILDFLPDNYTYTLYTGNSDHAFNSQYNTLVDSDKIVEIYAQNLSIIHPKCTLLPIGIANAMWKHGDMDSLYNVMTSTYLNRKNKDMYLNINTRTFKYREVVLQQALKNGFIQSSSKPYKEYLEELSDCHFCLCIRGNGIDTHRFWESLYLNVIPVIVNNIYTNCQVFVDNLNRVGVPFVEVNDLNHLTPKNFTYSRYKSIIKDTGHGILNSFGLSLKSLQM